MSQEFETRYLLDLKRILSYGSNKPDRTGIGTLSEFGLRYRIDLRDGFPLLTTKFVNFEIIKKELFWFLRGETNVNTLGARIWDEWADENGDLGPVYGVQWRNWDGTDQIKGMVDLLLNDPNSRRMVVSTWNLGALEQMRLYPCHVLFQLYSSHNELSLMIYQRSADMFLGVPFNIASYALLCHLFAKRCGMVAKELIWVGGDCHIYKNHVNSVKTQLEREPYLPPSIEIVRPQEELWKYREHHVVLNNYKHYEPIKAKVAV